MSAVLDTQALAWSVEAEQAIIGCALVTGELADVEPADFYDARHRAYWQAARTLAAASQPIDVLTLWDALSERDSESLGYLNQLAMSVTSARGVKRYAAIVQERAQQRRLLAATLEAQDTAMNGEGTPAEKLSAIVGMLSGLQRTQAKGLPRSLAEIAVERTAYYEALERRTVEPGMRTRIPALDRMLNGGLREGGLYILAARPAVGKSSFSQALSLNLAQDGHGVLFLSQEMPESEVADRAVSSIGRVSYGALQSGDMAGDAWDRVSEAMEELRRLPFHVSDQPSLTLLDIRTKVQQTRGLKVLVLDYLQLCASTRKDGNRNSEIEEISRGLKALAKESRIAVIALSQLNRDVEKRAVKRPNLGDLRDSGAIEQDADVVMFLWPVRKLEHEGRAIVGCGVDKNRQGRTGEFGLDFWGDVQRWGESTADIRPPVNTSARKEGFND